MEYFVLGLLILPFVLTLIGIVLFPFQLDKDEQVANTSLQCFSFKSRYMMENCLYALSLKYFILSYKVIDDLKNASCSAAK